MWLLCVRRNVKRNVGGSIDHCSLFATCVEVELAQRLHVCDELTKYAADHVLVKRKTELASSAQGQTGKQKNSHTNENSVNVKKDVLFQNVDLVEY